MRGLAAHGGSVNHPWRDARGHEMSAPDNAADYLSKVSAVELHDPALTMQIANGFEARSVIAGHIECPAVNIRASLNRLAQP